MHFRRLAAAAVLTAICLIPATLTRRERLIDPAAAPSGVGSAPRIVGEPGEKALGRESLADRGGAARPGGVISAPVLPRRQSEWWVQPVAEPVFARFKAWTDRWREAGPAEKPALEAEGRTVARERQRALCDLIQGHPQRALELAVPPGIRGDLPDSVAAYLEKWVNRRGDLWVAGAMPVPGDRDDGPSIVRWAEFEGTAALVFTYGTGLDWMTKRGVALNGIALPAGAGTNPPDCTLVAADTVMALSDSPVRSLEDEEVDGLLAAQSAAPDCPTSARPVTEHATPVGTEIGGEVRLYCGVAHAATAASSLEAAENLGLPDGVAAAGEPPTAASGYTQGYKRILMLRVDFPDYPGEQATIPLAEAETLLTNLRRYMLLMSYGSHALAPAGPGGSAITPVLRMDLNASSYDNAGLSKLYPDARAKAQAAGFDLSKYDWCGVFTKGKPAAGYAGLAYVGGVGFHMAGGYFGKHVTSHEFGHNLGLPHAHRWNTGDESTIGPGSLVEYGNAYDPIGATYDTIPGEKHFVGSYKNYLDWIPDADAAQVSASGVYRLTTSDDDHARGRRVLRLKKDSRDYWLEFRHTLSDTRLSHGVFLQWAGTDGRENYLLDAEPGASPVNLPIGRTFSDRAANGKVGVHVTPLRLGGTFPESMDVQVTIGSSAGNRAPTVTVNANTLAAPAATPVVLAATAYDPDADALAYSWDFGDGSVSTDTQATQIHKFPNAGDFAVQCTVSDMKGGSARDTVLVRIDAPSSHRIAGRVLDMTQQPVVGIQISAVSGSEKKLAWTDSDGSYTLTNLGPKAWTLTAREVVSDALNFSMPFFTNPLTVGPDLTGADFIASSGPQETITPLIAKSSVWRWFSQGTDPPVGWTGEAFDDAAWNEGAGVLGYGNEGGQSTTIPYGPSTSNKWTGYYFRRVFSLADPTAFPTIRLEVKRDDGAIVYLNGREIFRDNMPAGPATEATQAIDTTEPNDYLVKDLAVTDLPAGVLVAGTNVLTAEVHQASATSSDLAFDAALSGVTPLSGAGGSAVYVSSPAEGAVLSGPPPLISLEAVAKAGASPAVKVEFFADGTKVGESASAPFAASWINPAAGAHSLHVVATLPGGAAVASAATRIQISPAPTVLIGPTANWKYWATGAAAPAGWSGLAFNDAGWAAGPAPLGFGDGDEATIIPSGTATTRPMTSYFRHTFTVADPRAVAALIAHLIRDDGAAVYLNGIEIIRSNLPAGALSHDTPATGAGPNLIENAEFAFPLDPVLLVPGRNVLAAEVHQTDATSSDLSFACWLEARTTADRPRGLALTGPASVVRGQTAELVADVVAGGALGITRVEFLANGVVVGADTVAPFAFSWPNPAVGNHGLTAVATDSAGDAIASQPIELAVLPPAVGAALVSFGDTWRYLDDGSTPASNWRALTGYDDTPWSQGRARLGYGGDGEATPLGYGAEASAKHITTWLRKKFIVANPGAFSSLLLRLIRDDGAIISLNGAEVFRSNMPPGAATPTTLASAELNAAEEREIVEGSLPASSLLAGENVLAVEVHQASPGSVDLGFDFELLGLAPALQPFFLVTPAAGQRFGVATPVPLSVYAAVPLGVARVEYFAGPAKIGESAAGPDFALTWTTPLLGSYGLSARATLAEGGSQTAAPVPITVGDAPASTQFFPAGATWKYWDAGTLPGATWTTAGFADDSWASGPARLGFGADREATPLTSGHMTYYFRKSFNFASTLAMTELALRFQRDDGVVIYLNGSEVARDNMPAGPPLPTTAASADAADDQAWLRRLLPPSALQPGLNVLAAEVHQRVITSSDIGWDCELTAIGTIPSAIANTAPSVLPVPSFATTPPGSGGDLGLQFRFSDTTGRLYLIEGSGDLKSWQPESYEFVRAGQVQVPLAAPAGSLRFYRARWLPALP